MAEDLHVSEKPQGEQTALALRYRWPGVRWRLGREWHCWQLTRRPDDPRMWLRG
jgi:hypothetical protein